MQLQVFITIITVTLNLKIIIVFKYITNTEQKKKYCTIYLIYFSFYSLEALVLLFNKKNK